MVGQPSIPPNGHFEKGPTVVSKGSEERANQLARTSILRNLQDRTFSRSGCYQSLRFAGFPYAKNAHFRTVFLQ